MSNELVPVNLEQLPVVSGGLDITNVVFADLAKGTEFLDRIQLYTKGQYVDRGLIKPGRYGVPKSDDQIDDLGEEIDIIPFCCRPKALDLRDRDAIVTSYEPESELFQTIKALAGEVNSSCMYGPTFLVFERNTGKFYELFCGTKSMRNEAGKIGLFLQLPPEAAEALQIKTGKPVQPHGPLPCTLRIKYVKKGNWGWHVPVAGQCSTPFTNLPPLDTISAEITRFMEAKSSTIEKVEETSASKRAR